MPRSDDATNYPTIILAIKTGLAKLSLSELPQDCVVLCGVNISPTKLGQHLVTAGLGQIQVYHGGVHHFDRWGTAEFLPSTWDNEEQEKVGRSWLSGEGGSLITHNIMFSGCEAATAFFISKCADEPAVRSGLLRGVARMVLVGGNVGTWGYKKEKLQGRFDVYEI